MLTYKIDNFDSRSLCTIKWIRWCYHTFSTKINECMNQPPMYCLIAWCRVCWFGHLVPPPSWSPNLHYLPLQPLWCWMEKALWCCFYMLEGCGPKWFGVSTAGSWGDRENCQGMMQMAFQCQTCWLDASLTWDMMIMMICTIQRFVYHGDAGRFWQAHWGCVLSPQYNSPNGSGPCFSDTGLDECRVVSHPVDTQATQED